VSGKINPSQYGFSQDRADIEAVTAWREAAIADGWTSEPTYGDREPEQSAARLRHPEGFVAQTIAREFPPERSRYRYSASVNVWGPDGMSVIPPNTYDMAAIRGALRTCENCRATDVDTVRFSFAGRCCQKCRPAMAAKFEYPGWDL